MNAYRSLFMRARVVDLGAVVTTCQPVRGDLGWTLMLVGACNGDGTTDILWCIESTGDNAISVMEGAH